MATRPRRRLTLRDLMILVLMFGTGLASVRGIVTDSFVTPGLRFRPNLLAALRHNLLGPLLPCGLVWTLAVLLLGSGDSIPSRRHLARRPGMAACVAAASVAALGGLSLVLILAARFYAGANPIALSDRFMTRFMELMAPYLGTGVLVAWLMLMLNGT
jgi:hypothetical protein